MRHLLRLLALFALYALAGCRSDRYGTEFTASELSLIHSADSIMRVLTVESEADLSVLRTPSTGLSARSLLSADYASLCSLMVATVTHPSQDGVGIAGPQVGLNRRVVAVQRFDLEGEPFVVYPNISIVWASDSTAYGPEGCLSVPGLRGDVLRSQEIVIEYALLPSGSAASQAPASGALRSADGRRLRRPSRSDSQSPVMVRDTVRGFTAVIFQHEIDHLDGILYTDRL